MKSNFTDNTGSMQFIGFYFAYVFSFYNQYQNFAPVSPFSHRLYHILCCRVRSFSCDSPAISAAELMNPHSRSRRQVSIRDRPHSSLSALIFKTVSRTHSEIAAGSPSADTRSSMYSSRIFPMRDTSAGV